MLANKKEQVSELSIALANDGFVCSVGSTDDGSIQKILDEHPDLVMAVMGDLQLDSEISLLQRIKREASPPLIALLSIDNLDLVDRCPSIDDFAVEPWRAAEVVARVKHIMNGTHTTSGRKTMISGDLTIDPANRAVIFEGRRVELTFREYELLAFLACNKGRVFSREELLRAVWDINYCGGGRTVDVHIRRLRIKFGDIFIETVRNVGYRFRVD